MAVRKTTTEIVEEIKSPEAVLKEKMLSTATRIVEINSEPSNEIQLEALKIALEIYKTCKE